LIFAGTNGFLDEVEVPQVERYQRELLSFADAHAGAVLNKIATRKVLDDEIRADLKKTLTEFKERFAAGAAVAR